MTGLTVFSRNLFEAPAEEWPEIEIEMTVVDGEIASRKEEEIQKKEVALLARKQILTRRPQDSSVAVSSAASSRMQA